MFFFSATDLSIESEVVNHFEKVVSGWIEGEGVTAVVVWARKEEDRDATLN